MSGISCSHCGALLLPEERACGSCGAPMTAEQQRALAERSARRRSRRRGAWLAVLALVLAGGAGVAWYLLRGPQLVPAQASQHPAAALIHLEKVFEERHPDYRGKLSRRVGVLVENRAENLVDCVKLALRVFDEDGVQLRNSRGAAGCYRRNGPLWPKDQVAEVFETQELEDGERYDLIVEALELGAPAVGTPPAKPLAVTVEPRLGVQDLAPYLRHELRDERLTRYNSDANLEIVFEVASTGEQEVTDLDYQLQVLDPAGKSLGQGFVSAAGLPASLHGRLPGLRPGQRRLLFTSAHLRQLPPEDFRWQLVVTRFSAIRAVPPPR